MTPILYYYYCLKDIAGPNFIDVSIEVDHILPQTLFDNSSIQEHEYLKHNIFNLALLPKRLNISKSNKTLQVITDSWLKNQIMTYEEIDQSEFIYYSDINNYIGLKEKRGALFKTVFSLNRNEKLNN